MSTYVGHITIGRWSSPEWTYSGTLAGEAGERGDAG
jgi:hypothetical protein